MYVRVKYNDITYLIPQYEAQRWNASYPPGSYSKLIEAYVYGLYEATGIMVDDGYQFA